MFTPKLSQWWDIASLYSVRNLCRSAWLSLLITYHWLLWCLLVRVCRYWNKEGWSGATRSEKSGSSSDIFRPFLQFCNYCYLCGFFTHETWNNRLNQRDLICRKTKLTAKEKSNLNLFLIMNPSVDPNLNNTVCNKWITKETKG